jgi:hypothetical protein
MDGLVPVISGAVEGIVDEAVFRRLVRAVRAEAGPVHGKAGKQQLLQRLPGYNSAARFSPWLVLVDLDQDAECVPPFRAENLPGPSAGMCFRVAVRSIESWLLADRERFASFLRVRAAQLPDRPDDQRNAKQLVITLARRSRSREMIEDIVPREGSGRSEGPAYASRMIEFISDERRGWRPHVAARSSDSLARCLRSLRRTMRADPADLER